MRQRNCPFCAESIGDTLSLCPHCDLPITPLRKDRRPSYDTLAFILVVIAIGWVVVSSCPQSETTTIKRRTFSEEVIQNRLMDDRL